MTKQQMFENGVQHIRAWCAANNVTPPIVDTENGDPGMFGTCAYYRDRVIYIDVKRCAGLGMAGRAWSYPGYVVDRTPYGVLAHELGHYVDGAHGTRGGKYGTWFRTETKAAPLTSYCDNDNEWFAEMFRLFVTNPDLLSDLRPAVFLRMEQQWPVFAERRFWQEILIAAPRQLLAAKRKVEDAQRQQVRTDIARSEALFP